MRSAPNRGFHSARPSIGARVAMLAAYLLPAVLLAGYGLAQPGLSRAAGHGELDATVLSPPSGSAQDLTAIGATDWAVWGYADGGTSTSLAPDVSKTGGSAIGSLELIEGDENPLISLRGLGQFPAAVPWTFDWSDGDATTTAVGAPLGLQWNGHDSIENVGQDVTGYGFRFSVPAGIQPQRLQVFTHAHGSTAELTAALSDESSGSVVLSHGTGGGNVPGIYTIDFAAGSDGQALEVEYVMTSRLTGPNEISANPAVYAVALAPQLVANGGFEQPVLPGVVANLTGGSENLTDWTVGGDGVDHLRTYWQPADGAQSIDLGANLVVSNGGNGSLSQSIPTVAGQDYLLTFAYSANPDAPIEWPAAAMDVEWGEDDPVTFSPARPPSLANMNWQRASLVVTGPAESSSTELTFAQTSGGVFGVALDDVSVIPYTPPGDGEEPIEVAAPVLFRAVPIDAQTTFFVGHTPEPGAYALTFSSSDECIDGTLGSEPAPIGGFDIVTTTEASYFAGSIDHGGDARTFVAVRVSGPDGTVSDLSRCIAIQPDNDSWVTALPLGVSSGSASTDGFLDSEGNARWFKFPITPGARVTVDLSSLPADYDLFLFKDIAQAYNDLTTVQDLTRLTAEFAPSAFAPSAFAPSAFAPSAFAPSAFAPSAFAPSAFAPSAFAPSAFAPSAFAPSAFAPSAFAPSAFAPSAFAPSAFAPSAFAPSAFAPSAFAPSAFASAQVRSLISISALPGTGNEWIIADTWNNTGDFYVRVSGKNGEFDTQDPFTLDVSISATTCAGVANPGGPLPTGVAGGYETIILTDLDRMLGLIPGNSATDKTAMSARLATLAARPDVDGVVVDVGADPRVAAMNAQADEEYACPYAKNLVAGAIKDIVDSYRAVNPDLQYVVLVGNDDVIPFFRYPDQSLLGPEQDYVPPVAGDTTSEASLRSNMVLGQDEYGAAVSISVRGATFPVPELAVGRLVETAAEVTGMVDAYLGTSAGVVGTPTSSLVTGYDFIADAADAIDLELTAGTGVQADRLVTPGHLSPEDPLSWTADDLRAAFLGERHDLAFLGGHFSANGALAADYATEMDTADLMASSVDLVNSIVFSIGCHSGYNVVDPHGIPGVTDLLDWPQAFARKGATLIAGTGYQYGDTDFIEYSERIYLEFSRQLRTGSGPVAVGDALVRAKLAYLAVTPDIRQLHEKALLESVVFGLPMLSVDMPGSRLPAPTSESDVDALESYADGPGSELDLGYFDLTSTAAIAAQTKALTNLDGGDPIVTTFFSGPDGVTTNPLEPALPLEARDVTVPGKVLRGVGFLGGTYSQQTLVPLTGAPNTEIRGVHVPFSSTVFYPIRPWTPNYFDALAQDGGKTNLLITPVQHRSAALGSIDALARTFGSLELRLFYSSNLQTFGTGADASTPALAAPPSITGVTAEVDGQTVTFRARVVGNPSAGIQEAWVTYTGHASRFDDLFLTQDPADSTIWSGSITLPITVDPTDLRFMVQAVNGVGLVTVADDFGALYGVSLPGTAAPAASSLSLTGSATSGALGDRVTVTATLTSSGPVTGKTIVFALGSTVAFATTDGSGVATTDMDVTTAGPLPLTGTFMGDAATGPSSATQAFAAGKATTSLTVVGPGSLTLGESGDVRATLSSGTASLTGKSVLFTFVAPGGATTYATRNTDIRGIATVPAAEAPVGVHTVTASFGQILAVTGIGDLGAVDPAYGASTGTTTYSVIWPFTGFLDPVSNPPALNTVKAGLSVPLKFSLDGDRGLAIIATGWPKAVPITCTSAPTDPVEETVTTNASGLQYSTQTGAYTYVWKTNKSWKGKCYRFDLKLVDGETHSALFKFS